jgi:hypothetical protein
VVLLIGARLAGKCSGLTIPRLPDAWVAVNFRLAVENF